MRKRRKAAGIEPPIREFADRGLQWVLVPENVKGLLLELSSEIASAIDFSQMTPLPKSFIPDNLRKQEADVLYRAPYRSPDGQEQEVWIYVLIEHQSTPDASIGFRLLFYMVGLWQLQRRDWQRKKLPTGEWKFHPVIPVVLYTGEEAWSTQPGLELLMELPEELRRFVPRFDTLMLRLKQTDPDELTATGHPFGWLLRVLQKENAPRAELERAIDEAVDHLAGLAKEDLEEWRRLIYFIYLLLAHRRSLSQAEAIGGRIAERVRRQGYQEAGNMIQTWAEEMLDKGRQEGLDRGRQEGREAGEIEALQNVVLDLLNEKFGPLSEETERRVQSLNDRAELSLLARKLLHATALAELGL